MAARPSPESRQIPQSTSLTHPDRILYPALGITKETVARYYQRVAPLMLPHIVGRPLSLVRCPQGQGETCFFQKHAQHGFAAPLVPVPIREEGKEASYLSIRDTEGLIALVQMGVLEIHPWGALADRPEAPDRLVFDLDPDTEVAWSAVTHAAEELRDRLAKFALRSFVKTSGGKGLHVLVPLSRDPRRFGWEQAKSFTKALAHSMEADAPDRYLAQASKAKRKGKIFIDYLRNAHGATAIAPYSTRAQPNAALAVPLEWAEIGLRDPALPFTLENVEQRLDKLHQDPWEDVTRVQQKLDPTRMAAEVGNTVPARSR